MKLFIQTISEMFGELFKSDEWWWLHGDKNKQALQFIRRNLQHFLWVLSSATKRNGQPMACIFFFLKKAVVSVFDFQTLSVCKLSLKIPKCKKHLKIFKTSKLVEQVIGEQLLHMKSLTTNGPFPCFTKWPIAQHSSQRKNTISKYCY